MALNGNCLASTTHRINYFGFPQHKLGAPCHATGTRKLSLRPIHMRSIGIGWSARCRIIANLPTISSASRARQWIQCTNVKSGDLASPRLADGMEDAIKSCVINYYTIYTIWINEFSRLWSVFCPKQKEYIGCTPPKNIILWIKSKLWSYSTMVYDRAYKADVQASGILCLAHSIQALTTRIKQNKKWIGHSWHLLNLVHLAYVIPMVNTPTPINAPFEFPNNKFILHLQISLSLPISYHSFAHISWNSITVSTRLDTSSSGSLVNWLGI